MTQGLIACSIASLLFKSNGTICLKTNAENKAVLIPKMFWKYGIFDQKFTLQAVIFFFFLI